MIFFSHFFCVSIIRVIKTDDLRISYIFQVIQMKFSQMADSKNANSEHGNELVPKDKMRKKNQEPNHKNQINKNIQISLFQEFIPAMQNDSNMRHRLYK